MPSEPRPSVWIIDDSRLEAQICERALSPTHDTHVFSDGAVMLERLAQDRVPDAIVVDWMMPGMSGLEVCTFVRRKLGPTELPILILTANNNREDRLAGLGAGATDYITKPFDPEELVARLGTHVQNKRLHDARREEAVFRERFIGILGHDLRQPLNTMIMGTHVLAKSQLSETQARTVTRLATAAQRMQRMVADLLDLTRIRGGDGLGITRSSVDLQEICEAVIDEMQLGHPARIFVLRTAGDTSGRWDRDRVIQACTNLVANAIEHGRTDRPIRVSVEGSAEDVTVRVENEGLPIPPEEIATLFDPFRRAGSQSQTGLGLGLFIVDQIVRGHRGSVGVESGERCTSFKITLPRREPPAISSSG